MNEPVDRHEDAVLAVKLRALGLPDDLPEIALGGIPSPSPETLERIKEKTRARIAGASPARAKILRRRARLKAAAAVLLAAVAAAGIWTNQARLQAGLQKALGLLPLERLQEQLILWTVPPLELPKVAGPGAAASFTWNLKAMPDFPDRIMVYKFAERDPAQVKENFKRYLHEGYRLDFYVGNQFSLTDEKATLSPFVDPEETELKQLPNEEEAVEIAVNFLKETGLYGPDIALTQTQILYETETRFKGDEKITYNICCLVPFSKFIDGYRIRGAHVTIGVGHKGNIDHATIGYMETRPYREVQIISPEEALELLTDEKSSLYIPDGAEELFIDNIELAYFEADERIAKQPYLQPVFVVSGKVKPVLDPEADTWQCIVPAIKRAGFST